MPDAYLSTFSYRTGASLPLVDLRQTIPPTYLDELLAQEIDEYNYYDGPIAPFLSDVVRPLHAGDARPDATVFASATLGNGTLDVFQLLADIGFPKLPLYGSTLNACTNAGIGIAMAIGLLAGGLATQVGVVTVDRCSNGNRLLPMTMGVLGDAAAACVVSASAPTDGYRILDAAVVTHSEAVSSRVSGWGSYTADLARSLHAASTNLYRRLGVGIAGVSCLVTNNMTRSAQRFLAACVGVKDEAVVFRNPDVVSHCYGADVIMGLEMLRREPTLQPGDLVVALASSWKSSAVFILERSTNPDVAS